MIKDNARFFFFKFIVMIIVNIIFVIVSLGLENIFGEINIPSLTDAQNLALTKTSLSAVAGILFFAYVFFITARMKCSSYADKRFLSIVKFAFRETIIYALYLCIIYAVIRAAGQNGLSESAARYVCIPHITFFQMGFTIISNIIFMILIFFTVSAVARLIGVRKPPSL